MKYKIVEILPGQLKVEYQDGSWAIVPVLPNASPEDIDHEVAKYDPEFLPKAETLMNYSVSLNEERSSKIKKGTEVKKQEQPAFVAKQYDPFEQIDIKMLLIGEYFAQQGDFRLKNALINKVKTIINDPLFSLYNYINAIENDPEELFRMAEEELNNG